MLDTLLKLTLLKKGMSGRSPSTRLSLAMAKTTSYSDAEIVSVSGTLKFSSNNLFAFYDMQDQRNSLLKHILERING